MWQVEVIQVEMVLPEVYYEFQNQYFLHMILHLVHKSNHFQYFICHQMQGRLMVTNHLMYSMKLHMFQENFSSDCAPYLFSNDDTALFSPFYVDSRLHPNKHNAPREIYRLNHHLHIPPLHTHHGSFQITYFKYYPQKYQSSPN